MNGTRINPLLVVNNLDKSVDFYENTLGFKKNITAKGEYGSLAYVDFLIGETVLMVVPENTRPKPIANKGGGVEFYIDIDEDIKSLFESLKAKGLKFTKELYETPWHTLQFQFQDLDGYVLIVSQEIKKSSV